jgi:hypothetical protein
MCAGLRNGLQLMTNGITIKQKSFGDVTVTGAGAQSNYTYTLKKAHKWEVKNQYQTF